MLPPLSVVLSSAVTCRYWLPVVLNPLKFAVLTLLPLAIMLKIAPSFMVSVLLPFNGVPTVALNMPPLLTTTAPAIKLGLPPEPVGRVLRVAPELTLTVPMLSAMVPPLRARVP